MIVGLGLATSKLHIRVAFYTVVAQILPVLLLAIIVEGRYFRDLHHRAPFERFLLRGLLYTPIIGETACLVVVAQGHDALLLRGAALFAVGVLCLLMLTYAANGPASTSAGNHAGTNDRKPASEPDEP